MTIRKPVVVLADTNPANITLSKEISGAKRISLVYFEIVQHSNSLYIPQNNHWFLKIDQGCIIRDDLIVPSNNQPAGIGSTFRRITSNMVPLHLKPMNPVFLGGSFIQTRGFYGKQPKGMRWEAHDVNDFTAFQITITNRSGTVIPLDAGASYQLVFDVEWESESFLPATVRATQVYKNSLNG